MNRLLLPFFLLIISLTSFSQEKGYLEFAGRCIKDHQPLKGANITIYKGSTKVTGLTTSKNGKFQFFLEFGVDYKVVYTFQGCADMYLMIFAGKCDAKKEIFPIYDVDVNFFDYGKPTINYENFKNPFTKINYDGKKTFKDDEPYVQDFLEKLYVDPEEIKKRDALYATEKEKKELEAKLKLANEEKLHQQQLAEAEKQAQEEADRQKKLAEAEKLAQQKQQPQPETKNVVASKENETKQSMASEELQLTIDKEKRNLKEKQNKAIRSSYENDLLKIVATNERSQKESQFKKEKGRAAINEVIEALQKEAEVKARSEQIMFDSKLRSKQAVLNSRVKNQEMLVLLKQKAYNERNIQYSTTKKFPEPKNYKPHGLIGITSDVEHETFKTIYTYNVSNGNEKTSFRKETYSWGVNYYYKNDKEISEKDYAQEISSYNIPL